MDHRKALSIQEEVSPLNLLVKELRKRHPDKSVCITTKFWHMSHKPDPHIVYIIYINGVMSQEFKSCDALIDWWQRRKLIFKKF